MNKLEEDGGFGWAWEQSPSVKALEALEREGCISGFWDRRWLFDGPIRDYEFPMSFCVCRPERTCPVNLNMKAEIIDDENGKTSRIAVGNCGWCRTIYWQSDAPEVIK